ncbi:MAG: cache domain-containing protein [Rubrivivax sp.]|nr:cache domain-containing protein [Rubrivivax sp.]
MRLRWAFLLIAVLPLLLASLGVAWVVQQRSHVLSQLHLAAVEPVLLASRRAELQSLVNLGRSSIAHLVRDGMPNAEAQQQALAILKRLEFGHDGYFFIVDFDGLVLLYPRQPQLQGRNLIDLQDRHGGFPIRQMLERARSGGGYLDYEWPRPSTGQVETKLAYVEPIAGWQWMLATGTYVDEPARAQRRIGEATESAVADTLWRVGAITALSSILVGVAALAINLNEQRKADAKLRAMAGQIVTSQEAERARVARELHDGVSQSLVSAKYVLESAVERSRALGESGRGEPGLTETLRAGVQRLRDVLVELRRISHDLRPALLDDLGLVHALEHLGSEWSARTGVRLVTDIEPGIPVPAEAVSTALFRVAQEALGNVERHAQARSVTLRLVRQGDGLVLHVLDDGRGFDAEQVARSPRHGLGLTHMRERIESLGGQFTLASSASGTLLRAHFSGPALGA